MALKPSEDEANQWIVRCYECHGELAELCLKSDLDLAIAQPVNLLEQPVQLPEQPSNQQAFPLQPWKIASFTLVPTANLKRK
jgi:alpha-mannosidase